MSEEKKLPAVTQEQARALDEAVMKEMDGMATSLPAEYKDDPTLPAEFKDAEALKGAVEARLGKEVKKVVYAPVGQMMRDGAEQFLKDHDPAFWERLQKYK
jgi:hypothetical protein